MIVNNVSLCAVAVEASQYPDDIKPEFAFVGRSNVGKSSLINSLINRKSLARTSGSPGKTRTINFYDVEDKLFFVDLPGYGYARISKSERAKWGKMVESYLCNREQLKCIILLVDIRHEPSRDDVLMYDWLNYYGVEVLLVATKADKINRSQINKHLSVIRKSLKINSDDKVVAFSSLSKFGKDELWNIIDDLMFV